LTPIDQCGRRVGMTDLRISTQDVQETITTEALDICPGVSARRITVQRLTGGLMTQEVKEDVHHTIETDDPHFGQFCVVEPELLERLRLTGWFHDADYGLISKEPLTRILSLKPYQVVRLRNYDHSLFDLEGQRLPVGVHFNYLDGRVNDYSFDLKRLLAHLQGRDDVTIQRERYCAQDIHRIPSYNAGDTSGYNGLSFIWHPTAELFRQYCAESSKTDHFGRYEAAHPLMGNEEFRVEPPATDDSL
jgi:hypothetical protein